MARVTRRCLQSLLKFVNSIIGIVGIAMILYGMWMVRVWQRDIDGSTYDSVPWFIYAFLGIGITLCVVTCLGHVAADTANGLCLSCDLPEDPTGRFDDFKDFVKSNFEICKWIGLSIVLAQGFSILLAMFLRTLGPDQSPYYDSDDDYTPARLPLLNHPVQPPPYIVGDPHFASKNDAWNLKIQEKV
ncbi:hypothetical protein L1049_010226 [Liquidambar formosana]|uniref:Tetraspanin n=1 Tax=Liquidambar formosana TaxID=63359 RepID=A0AAP0N8S2_LIQFO